MVFQVVPVKKTLGLSAKVVKIITVMAGFGSLFPIYVQADQKELWSVNFDLRDTASSLEFTAHIPDGSCKIVKSKSQATAVKVCMGNTSTTPHAVHIWIGEASSDQPGRPDDIKSENAKYYVLGFEGKRASIQTGDYVLEVSSK